MTAALTATAPCGCVTYAALLCLDRGYAAQRRGLEAAGFRLAEVDPAHAHVDVCRHMPVRADGTPLRPRTRDDDRPTARTAPHVRDGMAAAGVPTPASQA